MTDPSFPIQDPERIRALAHPIRLRLLDALTSGDRTELTASQCAERIGESVASCSFHLRTLAKYGFIEPAERRGREKPWRAVSRSIDVRPALHDLPGTLPATLELLRMHIEAATADMHRFTARAGAETGEWIDAITFTTSTFWASAEEMRAFSREVQRLTQRFAGRTDDPSARPEGAREARLFAAVYPDGPTETALTVGGDAGPPRAATAGSPEPQQPVAARLDAP